MSDQIAVPAKFVSNARLSVILEAETLDTASTSTVELMDSNRKKSIQSQDTAVTTTIQDEVINVDPVSGFSIYIPPNRNFMIHPVLNTESSLTLVDQSYSKEKSKEPTLEPTFEPDHETLHNAQISANGYLCLPNIASQTNGYVPIDQLVSEPKPLVIPNNGSYV
ncbi:unnamed protein product [Diamesa hyperborea]